jgi:hypothetical protein
MEKSSELCFFADLHYTAKLRVWQQGGEGLGEDVCKRASVMVLKEQNFTLRTKTLKAICFAKQSAKIDMRRVGVTTFIVLGVT